MFKFFQNLGRSLMLPVAVLPAGAIITGIGNLLNALHVLPTVAMFFSIVGTAILGQLGLIFAIGLLISKIWSIFQSVKKLFYPRYYNIYNDFSNFCYFERI